MGITINGPSGIDTASLIDQLVALEQDKVTTVTNKITTYQTQISDYSKLKSLVSDIAAKAKSLSIATNFDLFKSSSSDDSFVTISGGSGATEASYDISVFHLAKSEKMISKDSLVASQTAALSSYGITTGDISINGTTINITATDTIQDLRMKINNATDAQGSKLGVTASVLKLSDTNFRLVLSASETGANGVTYKDLNGGMTLTGLGIITDIAGGKGNTTQTVATNGDFKTMFDALAAGTAITYAGVDHDGNQVTNTFVKTAAGTSVDDFLAQVKTTFHSMADATIDTGTGKLVLTDAIGGTSQLAISSLNAGGAAQAVSVTQSGTNGAGVLSAGSNSYFQLEGLLMNNESNKPDDIIKGMTLEFHAASTTKTTTVSLERDVDGLQKKVTELVDAYNTLLTWSNSATKLADPGATKGSDAAKGGSLPGDMTVKNVVSQVRNELNSQFNLFGGTITNLTMIGFKSDAQTGQVSIDSAAFKKAVTKNFDEFERLFVTSGISDNKTVIYGRSTNTTGSGKYTIRESDALHMEIQVTGATAWYTSDARMGDVVTFSDGPAKGLSITAAAGVLGGLDASFTFSKGLSDKLSQLADSITNSSSGTITNHVNSLNSLITSTNTRVTRMQTSVDNYRVRLQKQFSAMEQALQTMKQQYAKMASALGLTTA
jgi:flagellar hook-associated protein 2